MSLVLVYLLAFFQDVVKFKKKFSFLFDFVADRNIINQAELIQKLMVLERFVSARGARFFFFLDSDSRYRLRFSFFYDSQLWPQAFIFWLFKTPTLIPLLV